MGKNIKTTIKIDGMSCANCAGRVKIALEKIEGIKTVSVNLDKMEAMVISKGKINLDEIKETINNLGFTILNIEAN